MRRVRTRGVTLVEILIVTSIMAVLMGISIGFISKLNRVVGLKAEAARIDAVLRQARNFAASEESDAVVVLDPEKNTITALGMKTVGFWHFEDEVTTGFGTDADVQGPKLTSSSSGGRFGRCFIFKSRDKINCGNLHTYALPMGFSFEAWVFPKDSKDMVIAQKGSGFRCGIEDGNFYGELNGVGRASTAQRKITVPMGRWSNVRLEFNGRRLKVFVDSALGGQVPKEKKVGKKGKKKKLVRPPRILYEPDDEADLVIGGEKGRFRGRIDEVRIGGITNEHTEVLSMSVMILAEKTSDLEIFFDASGKLNPAYHEAPVSITLVSRAEEDKKEVIEIGLMGVVK